MSSLISAWPELLRELPAEVVVPDALRGIDVNAFKFEIGRKNVLGPCMSCGSDRGQPAPHRCLHQANHVSGLSPLPAGTILKSSYDAPRALVGKRVKIVRKNEIGIVRDFVAAGSDLRSVWPEAPSKFTYVSKLPRLLIEQLLPAVGDDATRPGTWHGLGPHRVVPYFADHFEVL